MIYDAKSGRFTVDTQNLKLAAMNFRYAMRNIRKTAGLPLDKYDQQGAMTAADFAQKGILDGAKALGIDLGAEFGSELDLRGE